MPSLDHESFGHLRHRRDEGWVGWIHLPRFAECRDAEFDTSGVACSVGSACSSGSTELSPTLLAMGLPDEIVKSSLRFSLGATTTEAEIDEAVRRILSVVHELRQ